MLIKYNPLLKIKQLVPNFFGLWPVTKNKTNKTNKTVVGSVVTFQISFRVFISHQQRDMVTLWRGHPSSIMSDRIIYQSRDTFY